VARDSEVARSVRASLKAPNGEKGVSSRTARHGFHYPWASDGSTWVSCGVTFISPHFAITAAHCVPSNKLRPAAQEGQPVLSYVRPHITRILEALSLQDR
jgi:V8-like Glu-specific endopeptidase